MSPKKSAPPHMKGYKEGPYPRKTVKHIPDHGCGPRCWVDYNPNDEGPWTTVKIMNVDDDKEEDFLVMMPRCYTIPLILINKHLAFIEARCRPDGRPLPSSKLPMRDRREYNYLWHLRTCFLKAIFDLNHERRLNERWRFDRIHGFLHRTYKRFGHDTYQRQAYWRGEINEGRLPYTTPDVADMDWETYLLDDMKTSTRINAFLWNRVSQGYSRVVKDEPPFKSWKAWRAGHRDRELLPYDTHGAPASSSVRELRSELGEIVTAAAERTTQVAAPAAAAGTSSGTENAARCGVNVNEEKTGSEEVLTTAPAAARTGPRTRSQALTVPIRIAPPPPGEVSSPQASQVTSSTSSRGRNRRITLTFEAAERLEVTLIQLTHVENIEDRRDIKPIIEIASGSLQ